jgi:ribosomal-protein-serine acetyltransferase
MRQKMGPQKTDNSGLGSGAMLARLPGRLMGTAHRPGDQAGSVGIGQGFKYSAAGSIDVLSHPSGITMQTNFDPHSILIRPFKMGDAPLLYEAVHESIEQLRRWMTWCRAGYSIEDARCFIAKCGEAWEKGEAYSFAIVDLKDDTFLGSVGLNHVSATHNIANLGYWVRDMWAGRGVATSATRLIAGFGLQELGLNRLEILIPVGNVASRRVAQKAGAKFEGALRKRLILAGKCHDATMYSLVAADLAGSCFSGLTFP